jgi:hypothetical protein
MLVLGIRYNFIYNAYCNIMIVVPKHDRNSSEGGHF